MCNWRRQSQTYKCNVTTRTLAWAGSHLSLVHWSGLGWMGCRGNWTVLKEFYDYLFCQLLFLHNKLSSALLQVPAIGEYFNIYKHYCKLYVITKAK